MQPPSFGLDDIPDDWEIELNDDFVRFLDSVNRPWKYNPDGSFNPKGRHNPGQSATFWEAGYYAACRPRYRRKRTPDYFRRHNFFEKLWGYHRYHDAHVSRYGYIKKTDTGNWILKSELAVIREVINMTGEDFEEVITGFRKGIFSDNVRELHFARLPIKGNRWWAWLLGFYFGTGAIYRRERYYVGAEGPTIKMRVLEDVVPLLAEVIQIIGAKFLLRRQKSHTVTRKDVGLGTGTRRSLILGQPTYRVLVKMGLPTDFLHHKPNQSGSRSVKPQIPDWIKGNDEFMIAFLEGFVNSKGQSAISNSRTIRQQQPVPHLFVYLRMTGEPEEYVKQFLVDIQNWLEKQGIIGKLRKVEWYSATSGVVQYELSLQNSKAHRWLLRTLNIRRPDLRARLILIEEAHTNPALYEALRILRSPNDVILGLIVEKPRTREEFDSLQMMKEGIDASLVSLQSKGLIEKRNGTFH